MSDDIIIRAENLSKRYRISHLAGQSTLRDTMQHAARLAWRRLRWNTKLNREDFWALQDVNFEIKRGEVVGIIGRNGAGKSTLLKLLSRITEPTTGRITMKGRVASLLEVGTGFHPELTGRDNIFLNGAILGMNRVEIRKKFDEIVAFAEVERFLDTPVKRYSSGMYVRLAFAVAAHLEPEILIVDEVLAVGDVAFQKKCLGKMQDVAANQGRTVLFVSHNLGMMERLCQQAIYMEGGRIASQGPVLPQIQSYIQNQRSDSIHAGGKKIEIGPSLILESLNLNPKPVRSGAELEFELVLRSKANTTVHDVCLTIHSSLGGRVAIIDLRRSEGPYQLGAETPLIIGGRVRKLGLVEGDYSIGLYLNSTDFTGDLADLQTLSINGSALERVVTPYPPHDRGLVELDYDFEPQLQARICLKI